MPDIEKTKTNYTGGPWYLLRSGTMLTELSVDQTRNLPISRFLQTEPIIFLLLSPITKI